MVPDDRSFRAASTILNQDASLGLLHNLPGTWIGTGFNLIARPDHQQKKPFFLEVNPTTEIIEFTAIGGDVPNRGSVQNDINIHGLRYLQRVCDARDNSALHLEPGLWLHVPPTTDPKADETYVRQASIPHGDSLLAQSNFFTSVNGGPLLNPVSTIPFTGTAMPGLNEVSPNIITAPGYLAPYSTTTLPPHFLPPGFTTAQIIHNPVLVLESVVKSQVILKTEVIGISSAPAGGIVNIPFVVQNANAVRIDAIFWVETVSLPSGQTFMQLQYVQRVILDFDILPDLGIIHWPHVSVATLVKQ